ncbi:RNA polymerase sigma factor [Spongiimicrobium salis]|uniref:RNA polymerase sigma factor n=1 Tax=Spongiimicrobium salis TaxID=1667022 RepID=UPI00374DA6FE
MELDLLIQRFQKKDAIAFERLYNMYSENILGVINTIVKNSELSEEIAQDVFVKIWNNAEKYNASKGRFFTWILNIARNAAIDAVRSKSYKDSQKNLSADFFVNILEDNDSLDNRVDAIGIKNLLKNMKEKCVQTIDMLYFKGYTQKEAAEELGIPIGTIKTRNRNCILELRELVNV